MFSEEKSQIALIGRQNPLGPEEENKIFNKINFRNIN